MNGTTELPKETAEVGHEKSNHQKQLFNAKFQYKNRKLIRRKTRSLRCSLKAITPGNRADAISRSYEGTPLYSRLAPESYCTRMTR
jgi:hypothetical protein